MGWTGRYTLYAAAAAGLLLTPLLGGTALADIYEPLSSICPTNACIPFNLNYGTAPGYNSTTVDSIGYLSVNDASIVDQNFTTGAFEETGVINVTQAYINSALGVDISTSTPLTGLYITFTLTGTLSGTTITFNTSASSPTIQIDEWYASGASGNATINPLTGLYTGGATATELATFASLGGAATASTGITTGAGGTVSGETLTSVQTTGPDDSLYTTTSGTPLFGITGALANEILSDGATVGAFGPCSSDSDPTFNPVGGECATATTTASEYIETVPEPASLVLFGSGLISLAAIGRRRRKGAKGSEAA
jgi:hypothetical protein